MSAHDEQDIRSNYLIPRGPDYRLDVPLQPAALRAVREFRGHHDSPNFNELVGRAVRRLEYGLEVDLLGDLILSMDNTSTHPRPVPPPLLHEFDNCEASCSIRVVVPAETARILGMIETVENVPPPDLVNEALIYSGEIDGRIATNARIYRSYYQDGSIKPYGQ